MNKQLAVVQEQWDREILYPYVEKYGDAELSRPFYCGVSEEYVASPRRIMIVGQETRNYGSYTDDWPAEAIRQWGIDYLRRQLWGIRAKEFDYNRSGFWMLFRAFLRAGYVPCWNNIDKIHRRKENRGTIRLTDDMKQKFCCRYATDHRSLLQREIEIAKPDAVLFVTGPHYGLSMIESLGVSSEELEEKRPGTNCICRDITQEAKLGIPVFWSYHPSYLNRIHKLANCVQTVLDAIKKP